MLTSEKSQITEELETQYREEGYFILENVISQPDLTMLREECQIAMDGMDAWFAKRPNKRHNGLNISDGSRYFIQNASKERRQLYKLIFNDLMADICRATIGEKAYFFWDQFVVKGKEKGASFAWHQDSGYEPDIQTHLPYATCWLTLDDMSEANGTVCLLPYSRAGSRNLRDHTKVFEGSSELQGYHGDDPGIPAIVPAGSIVVFSSHTFHRSGVNTTDRLRRSFFVGYTPDLHKFKDPTKGTHGRSEPFLENGRRVDPSAFE